MLFRSRPNDAAPGQSHVTDGSGGQRRECERDDRFVQGGRAEDDSGRPAIVKEAIGGEEREAGDTSKPCAGDDGGRYPEVAPAEEPRAGTPPPPPYPPPGSGAPPAPLPVPPQPGEHGQGRDGAGTGLQAQEPHYQSGQCHWGWTPPVEERNDAEDGAGYQREGWDDGWKESSPWPRGAEEEVDGGGQENPFSAEKSPARRPIPESLKEQRGEIVVKVIIDGKPAARNEGQRWIRLRPVQMASDSRVVVDLRGSDAAQERIGAEVGGREIADGCKPGGKPREEVNAVEEIGRAHV